MPTLSPRLGNLFSLVAGLLFPLGLAPLSWWPFTVVSLGLFVYLLHDLTPKRALWRSWWYGFGFYTAGASWVFVSIHTYGHAPLPLAVVLTGLFTASLGIFFAAFGWLYSTLQLSRCVLLGFPALWVIFEWIKSWILSGFPWLYAGYGFIDTPLSILAPITGVLGMSWCVCFISALTATTLQSAFPSKLQSALQSTRTATLILRISAVVGLWAFAFIVPLPQPEWTQRSTQNALSVAVIQGNIPQEQKWDPAYQNSIFATYIKLTQPHWDKDVVIWPEAALPIFYQDALPTMTRLAEKGYRTDTALITGTPYVEGFGDEKRYFNSIIAIGNGKNVYHKQRLVPFGEYVPAGSLIRGLIPFFNLPMSNFTPGAPDQQPLRASGAGFAPSICYEIVYPELVRKLARNADFLITISNDAWFGTSWGPHQHVQMVRMRALELGKYLVRGTNTGVTAIIDHHGAIQQQIPPFQAGTLTGTLYRTTGTTPYASWGWLPTLAWSWLSLFGAIMVYRLGKKRSH